MLCFGSLFSSVSRSTPVHIQIIALPRKCEMARNVVRLTFPPLNQGQSAVVIGVESLVLVWSTT